MTGIEAFGFLHCVSASRSLCLVLDLYNLIFGFHSICLCVDALSSDVDVRWVLRRSKK